jgi:hypothetical protein
MKKISLAIGLTLLGMFVCQAGFAKLPDPSPEAKEATELAKAKAAHSDKVAAFKLCEAQNKVAKSYASKDKVVQTPACADPGEFIPPTAPTTAAQSSAASAPVTAAVKQSDGKPAQDPKK